MKVFVLGGTGMLGHQIIKGCIKRNIDWVTTVRNKDRLLNILGVTDKGQICQIADIKDIGQIENAIERERPDYVVNCVGIVKQSSLASNHEESISINSLLPHQLERICHSNNCRLIHISTDCVFDGKKGMYVETDFSDANDLYGRSKLLGEVQYGSAITLRTSIIGPEISEAHHGLVEWFLGEKGVIQGYKNAFFSGLTTLELANVILDIILPKGIPTGLYHVASDRISKYDLLKIVASVYKRDIEIQESEMLKIDRSLNSQKFNELTGYKCPPWPELISAMYAEI